MRLGRIWRRQSATHLEDESPPQHKKSRTGERGCLLRLTSSQRTRAGRKQQKSAEEQTTQLEIIGLALLLHVVRYYCHRYYILVTMQDAEISSMGAHHDNQIAFGRPKTGLG